MSTTLVFTYSDKGKVKSWVIVPENWRNKRDKIALLERALEIESPEFNEHIDTDLLELLRVNVEKGKLSNKAITKTDSAIELKLLKRDWILNNT